MATNCSILAWEIPWTEEPGVLQYLGSQTAGTTSDLAAAAAMRETGDMGSIGRSPGEGNGNPLQHPCMENP